MEEGQEGKQDKPKETSASPEIPIQVDENRFQKHVNSLNFRVNFLRDHIETIMDAEQAFWIANMVRNMKKLLDSPDGDRKDVSDLVVSEVATIKADAASKLEALRKAARLVVINLQTGIENITTLHEKATRTEEYLDALCANMLFIYDQSKEAYDDFFHIIPTNFSIKVDTSDTPKRSILKSKPRHRDPSSDPSTEVEKDEKVKFADVKVSEDEADEHKEDDQKGDQKDDEKDEKDDQKDEKHKKKGIRFRQPTLLMSALSITATSSIPVTPSGKSSKPFLTYLLDVTDEIGRQRTILRSYQELKEFHQELEKVYGKILPKFPKVEKVKLKQDLLEKQKKDIVQYLSDLSKMESIMESKLLKAFLSDDPKMIKTVSASLIEVDKKKKNM